MITILIVLLVLAMLGSLPSWPYSTGWGYYPSSGLGSHSSDPRRFGACGPALTWNSGAAQWIRKSCGY